RRFLVNPGIFGTLANGVLPEFSVFAGNSGNTLEAWQPHVPNNKGRNLGYWFGSFSWYICRQFRQGWSSVFQGPISESLQCPGHDFRNFFRRGLVERFSKCLSKLSTPIIVMRRIVCDLQILGAFSVA